MGQPPLNSTTRQFLHHASHRADRERTPDHRGPFKLTDPLGRQFHRTAQKDDGDAGARQGLQFIPPRDQPTQFQHDGARLRNLRTMERHQRWGKLYVTHRIEAPFDQLGPQVRPRPALPVDNPDYWLSCHFAPEYLSL